MDEGIDHVLDVLQEETLTNSLYPVILMHDEKRPLSEFYYPHNPRRKVYWTEDSRAYWHFDPAFYRDSRIKPRPSEDAELKDTDWVAFFAAARKRGMLAGVEFSHTWVDKERLREEFADCVQRDVSGKPSATQLCPNNPHTVAYATALYTELATRYDLDFIQTCFLGFAGAPSYRQKLSEVERLSRLPLGTCFCESCRVAAEAQGLPWEAIVDRVRRLAAGHDRYNAREAFALRLCWPAPPPRRSCSSRCRSSTPGSASAATPTCASGRPSTRPPTPPARASTCASTTAGSTPRCWAST